MTSRFLSRRSLLAVTTVLALGWAGATRAWALPAETGAAQADLLERLHAAGSLLGPAGVELARATAAATSLTEVRRLAAQFEGSLALSMRPLTSFDASSTRILLSPTGSATRPTSGRLSAHGQVAPRPIPGQSKYPMRGTWLPSPDAD